MSPFMPRFRNCLHESVVVRMDANEQKVSINVISDDKPSDGFNALVVFHRFTGIVYFGYGHNQRTTTKIVLAVWAALVWTLIFLMNTPCLVHCFFEDNQVDNRMAFYLFNIMFMGFTTSNIFCSVLISFRGRRIRELVKSLRESVTDRRIWRKQKILVIIMIGWSIILSLFKIVLITGLREGEEYSITDVVRGFEDMVTEAMTDSVIYLLIYFSRYICLNVDEVNDKIKDNFKKNDIDFEYIHKSIAKIQKHIREANRLLNPCLLFVFIINISFMITFWYFVQNLSDNAVKDRFLNVWPLLVVFMLRMLACCLSVDRMNIKVQETFEIVFSRSLPDDYDKSKLNSILGLQQTQQTFNAYNFFQINNSLFLSVVGISLSYTLLVYQSLNVIK